MINVGCVFEEKVIKLDDAAFKSLLDDALGALGKKIEEARASIKAEKAAVVAGVPTLAEKGVEIGVTVRF